MPWNEWKRTAVIPVPIDCDTSQVGCELPQDERKIFLFEFTSPYPATPLMGKAQLKGREREPELNGCTSPWELPQNVILDKREWDGILPCFGRQLQLYRG